MKINRALIRGTNWALAGLISLLGFAGGCEKENLVEYGVPNADYTVKGVVVNKTDGKPIEGIRVRYTPYTGEGPKLMYGVPPSPYEPKTYVTTDSKGEFKLTENSFPVSNQTVPVFIDDIDGELNGLFKSDTLYVDFSKAEQTKKSHRWYEGEYTVTVKVELKEVENESEAGNE